MSRTLSPSTAKPFGLARVTVVWGPAAFDLLCPASSTDSPGGIGQAGGRERRGAMRR